MNRWDPGYRPIERSPKGINKIQVGPPLILSLSFVAVIFLGTVILKLPMMTHEPISWIQSLFTSTSAVTVTGLVVVDTGSVFTTAGQAVIAVLIQLGGLGLMTFAIVTLIALGSKISFLQQSAVKEAFNQTDLSTLVSTAKSVLIFAFFVELVGFCILSAYWMQEKGVSEALFHAFFYTISAFNNAGFALSGDSLSAYVGDPIINITISALFIIGGLGFSVWIELHKKRRWQRISVYAKTMILGTLIVNVTAFLLIFVIESDNPATLANLDTQSALWASWFQAVTPRTAGFNTLDIASLEDPTTALMLLLMFIGGGSMSTASGIKLMTFIVLIIAAYNYIQRGAAPRLFGRTISNDTISKALALTMISIGITWIAIFLLLMSEKADFLDIVFEAVSALGTVGLSRGLTGDLSDSGEWIIILLMYAGRLGPLTLAYFIASPRISRIKYPEAKLAIG